MSAIVCEALSAGFDTRRRGATQVLASVHLQVTPGETFGLIGPSGCGKSTLLRILAGLHSQWNGKVSVFGHALQPERYPHDTMRSLVQMVFQDPYASLHPRHTVGRALLEPLKINRVPEPLKRMRQALDDVGLPPGIEQRYPNQMSGGQRQRVAIARALLLQPTLLLLDEPTSALDVSVQAEILNLLNQLKARYGMTMLLVSHDAGVVAHMCDRAAVMRAGSIQRILTRTELTDLQ
ncbi:ABC transporter ATP-binding protein [Dyella caseinilytica]|uniref:Glutathione import ATP-binding protein GsiA n=1 Tax=Dyella caseinilytica TaxID=1849581 RepID=A0ABX7GYX9_9GAMM|nr:ABC transporter ATP-binding protein [Dyella caseinilytica]QRN55499.1 ABC transporter ATP-binding protein [Dyella caseinilytica]GGA02209.1 ABC transporter ATP-binding protein [Dyella caseinilytica]